MKRTIFYLSLLSLKLTGQPLPNKLLGKWHLDKIVKENQVLRSLAIEYWIKFDQTIITFNHAVNTCMCAPIKFENDSLSLTEISCTEICCDDRVDNFYKNLNYEGKIKFISDTLLIENTQGTYYLTKKSK